MGTLTHTLDLDPLVDWHIVGTPKARRPEAAAVGCSGPAPDRESVPDRASAPDRESALDENPVSRSRRTRIRSSFGDATQFGFFALTLAAIGWLHVELLALIW